VGSGVSRGDATRGFLLGVHGHLQRLSVPGSPRPSRRQTTHLTWSSPAIDAKTALPVTRGRAGHAGRLPGLPGRPRPLL